jgi:hypothetical protein
MKRTETPEAPELARDDRVRVTEENIEPWLGTVNSIKLSKVSGWWIDVDRDDVGVWSICLATGTTVERI